MKCCYCSHENLEKSNFCSKCKNQIKCMECSDILEENSEICVTCGSDIKKKTTNFNTIEFKEGKNTKSFKATFSDTVGQNIAEAFGMLIMKKSTENNKINLALKNSENPIIEDIEHVEVQEDVKVSETKLDNIFKERNGKITLLETRLKASSKRDYSIRLTLIFLYYKLLKGQEEVQRSELTSIAKDAGVEDGNFRSWLGSNDLLGIHEDKIELKAGGRELAQEYINDIQNESKEDKWKVGKPSKKRSKKKEGGNDD